MLPADDEYQPRHHQPKTKRSKPAIGELNIQQMHEDSHDKNDKTVTDFYDDFREDLIDQDIPDH